MPWLGCDATYGRLNSRDGAFRDFLVPPLRRWLRSSQETWSAIQNTWTHWGNEAVYGMTFPDREPLRYRYPNEPYSMIGPVVVANAEPGDVIECRL
jgi:hypothetical protein